MFNPKISGIYLITPDKLLDFTQIERLIIAHKISILQYRSKSPDLARKSAEALQLLALCRKYQTLFIINDDPILAQKVDADGVHLGKNDPSIQDAKSHLAKNKIIGITCGQDLNYAKKVAAAGATYLAFGAIFPSQTKPNTTTCPIKTIIQARKTLHLPIITIGGITLKTSPDLLKISHATAISHNLFTNT